MNLFKVGKKVSFLQISIVPSFREANEVQSFRLCLLLVFDRSNIFEPSKEFFEKFESSLEV